MRLPEQQRENNLEPNSVALLGPNLAKDIDIDIWFEVLSNLSPCLVANAASSVFACANRFSRCVIRDNKPDLPIDNSVMKRSMSGAEDARPGYLQQITGKSASALKQNSRTMRTRDAQAQNLPVQAVDQRFSTGKANNRRQGPAKKMSATS